MLICAVIVLAGVIVWNLWVFNTIARGGAIGSVEPNSPQVFKKSFLDDVRPIFEKRADEAKKYETGVYRYADPSK